MYKRDERGRFMPGTSAGPGRPTGARDKLGRAFLEALADDFEQHGPGVICQVRAEKPADYLKICVSLIPKDLVVTVNPLEALSDDELHNRIKQLDAELLALDAVGSSGVENGSSGPTQDQ